MKLIKHTENGLCKQIVIEKKFLFFTWQETYRQYIATNTIVEIKNGEIHSNSLGLIEYYKVKTLFNASY